MGAAALRATRLRPRVWVAIVVLLVAALAGGWMWLRDSSLVTADKVTVSGATGPEAGAIVAALERSGRTMTTLNVDRDRLREAVAVYPQVKDIKVQAKPLHALHIEVVERPPVAALAVGDQRTPVAADGTVLRGRVSAEGLPAVQVASLPAGGVVGRGRTAEALGVLAAAPAALRKLVESVAVTDGQVSAQLRGGPRVILGAPERARAKWAAAARVLSDESSKGAGYIDVRLPERPAAGGFPATEANDATEQPSTSTPG